VIETYLWELLAKRILGDTKLLHIVERFLDHHQLSLLEDKAYFLECERYCEEYCEELDLIDPTRNQQPPATLHSQSVMTLVVIRSRRSRPFRSSTAYWTSWRGGRLWLRTSWGRTRLSSETKYVVASGSSTTFCPTCPTRYGFCERRGRRTHPVVAALDGEYCHERGWSRLFPIQSLG